MYDEESRFSALISRDLLSVPIPLGPLCILSQSVHVYESITSIRSGKDHVLILMNEIISTMLSFFFHFSFFYLIVRVYVSLGSLFSNFNTCIGSKFLVEYKTCLLTELVACLLKLVALFRALILYCHERNGRRYAMSNI